jgi:hypothetical protein
MPNFQGNSLNCGLEQSKTEARFSPKIWSAVQEALQKKYDRMLEVEQGSDEGLEATEEYYYFASLFTSKDAMNQK